MFGRATPRLKGPFVQPAQWGAPSPTPKLAEEIGTVVGLASCVALCAVFALWPHAESVNLHHLRHLRDLLRELPGWLVAAGLCLLCRQVLSICDTTN